MTECFDEIQKVIFANGGLAKAMNATGVDVNSVGTAIAAGLVASMGLTDPTAICIASVILYIVARAGANTFCKLTRNSVLEMISR